MARRKHAAAPATDLFEQAGLRVDREAARFSRALRHAAVSAANETELRLQIERELTRLGDKIGLDIEGRHEFTLLRGRIDTLYGSAFVEYKNPASTTDRLGPRLSHPGTAAVVQQIERRFVDIAELTGYGGARMLGIGCDGRYFIFVRRFEGRTEVEEPLEVSPWSTRRFLRALLNLREHGLILAPEFLAEDFGSASDRGQQGVRAFALALRDARGNPRVETFYRQWRIHFGEVCGYDLSNPTKKLRDLRLEYGLPQSVRPGEALFAVHTYYALFMKLLAAHVAVYFQRAGRSPLQEIEGAGTSEALQRRMTELEDGGDFKALGVTNFLEGDLFSWYRSAWSPAIEEAIRAIAQRLRAYNPSSLRDNPAHARDLLKGLYHALLPRRIRHDLGEYYTPDWLAELTLSRAGYDGNPKKRVLDPACGSGTFLVLALTRVRRWLETNFETAPDERVVADLVRHNVLGFDLNPVAVLAARANYLIHFFDLFEQYRGDLEIPVYLCDSVLAPSRYRPPAPQRELEQTPLPVPTSATLFHVPVEVTTRRETLATYCNLLADYARADSGFTAADLMDRCRDRNVRISRNGPIATQHLALFEAIRKLDRNRKNGVWARYIKNAFAPVFLGHEPVDFVIGNPPWVNWESLPGRMEAEGESQNYRQQIAVVFERYGLFTLSGAQGCLGGGKKDLSMVFVYACVDHYLKPGGKLAFVITQTLFKTKGAGDGFRGFAYDEHTGKPGRPPKARLKVLSVDDLSAFQPFEGATNRTAVFVCQKGKRSTTYPVRYTVWRKTHRGRLDPDWELPRVEDATEQTPLHAVPIRRDERTSPWLTAGKQALAVLRKVVGQSDYVAHAGTYTGGCNACYWLDVLREAPGGVFVENLYNVGKRKVPRIRHTIEPDLLYPLVRGRDVRRWSVAPSASLLLTQDPETRQGIPLAVMRRRYPRTFAYLKKLEPYLQERQSSSIRRLMESGPFYSMFAVGPYTMAPWKVMWPEVGNEVRAAVCGPTDSPDPGKPALPDHTIVAIACKSGREAYYACALLNSAPARSLVRGYITLHPSPHVLQFVRVPAYDSKSAAHRELAKLGKLAHRLTAENDTEALAECEAAIDRGAARIWRITKAELATVQRALPH